MENPTDLGLVKMLQKCEGLADKLGEALDGEEMSDGELALILSILFNKFGKQIYKSGDLGRAEEMCDKFKAMVLLNLEASGITRSEKLN